MNSRFQLFVLLGIFVLLLTTAQAQTKGIFADFTTSAGDFTIDLDFVRAPRTVANFIRLVEGSHSWMHPIDGSVATKPWYTNSALYRFQYTLAEVGATNPLALHGGLFRTDDGYSGQPGYTFLDEALNGLSHSIGTIAMVSSDGPHSNAAEFMLLLDDGAAYWDGQQTVFGHVSDGFPVVQTIANGGHDSGFLHSPASIQSITIRRVGAAAESYDSNHPDLPSVYNDGCRVDILSGNQAQYVYIKAPHSQTWMAHTDDLLKPQWTLFSMGFNGTAEEVDGSTPFSTAHEGWRSHFFHGTRVEYPVFSAIPLEDMAGITFAAQWSDGNIYQYWLNLSAGTGFWQNVTTTGQVVKIHDPYSMVAETRGANSTHFNFMDTYGNVFDYVLGFEAHGMTSGRYYLELRSGWGEFLGAEWGACEYAPWAPTVNSKPASLLATTQRRQFPKTGVVAKRGIRWFPPPID